MKDRLKNSLVEKLRQTPIAYIACKKTGISRATYYRWRKNKEFAKNADIAISEGLMLINDLAESQLLSSIQDKSMPGIIFWLKHRHPAYGNKLEITGRLDSDYDLTQEEKALVKKALKLALPKNKND